MRRIWLALVFMGLTQSVCRGGQNIPGPISDHSVQVAPAKFDLSAAKDIAVWDNVIFSGIAKPDSPIITGSYYGGPGSEWYRYDSSFICRSASDTRSGACSTSIALYRDPIRVGSTIKLRFTEEKSHSVIDCDLFAEVFATTKTWDRWPINDAAWGYANFGYYDRSLDVKIPSSELHKFTGGIWHARLILDHVTSLSDQFTSHKTVATWTADIILNVTDSGHADIFFPVFNTTTPVVNLNLNTRPLAPGSLPADRKNVSGGAHVDLCLYDGYNTHSPWLNVSVFDPKPKTVANRAPDVFSIMDSSGKVDDAHRLDYKVTLSYGGQSHPVTNGQPVRLENTDKGPARPVSLVNVPGTVLCAPAALDLSVLPFANLSKASGHYSGTLSVVLSANTQTP